MELDDTVCYCFHVSKRKIVNFIRIHQPRVPSQLAECGGAGTGCGWCVPFLKKSFRTEPGGDSELDRLTPEEYAKQRGDYIRRGDGKKLPSGAIPPPLTIDDTADEVVDDGVNKNNEAE